MENVINGLSKHNVAIEKKMKEIQRQLAEFKAAGAKGNQSNGLESTSGQTQAEIMSLKKQIAQLTAQCAEWEKKHADTVTTYRTHLLSAVQGHMDQDVKDALYHIIEIRSMEQFC
ncbi:unnamed protein product [Lymnaea stagnalis]|uniref:Uncharacterized protein n=1 Tax=Lymnaea stagnalis TaxID=6523 RepID=A0AAV2H7X0_LYMST